jgi:formylglycine-generating enzyme required for sulfatase activity
VYVQKLNARTGKAYRLPTEAEWEYACRAGGSNQFCGNDNIDAIGWYNGNSGKTTHPVATKQSNDFGLYDMSGNIWQWVEDWYHGNYNGAPTDGSAWLTGGDQKSRVVRGGSWELNPTLLRSSNRDFNSPVNRYDFIGFRVARALETP